MKITDLLKKESIELHGQVKTKEEAIDRMVELMVRSGRNHRNRRWNRHSPCQELRCGAGWFKRYGGTWRCGL